MTLQLPLLLLIDAGNTRIKWACIERSSEHHSERHLEHGSELSLPVQWIASGSLAHQDLNDLPALLSGFRVVEILMSNVAGATVGDALCSMFRSHFPQVPVQIFRSQAQCAGLQNLYIEPQRLGSDRFASAIAAHHWFPNQACVVATCGTATTIDAVDGADFLGGMILPGLQLMAASLAKNTAQLPQIAQHMGLQDTFARSTDQAIVSGCVHAQVGAMLSAIDHLRQRSQQPVQLLISGGAAVFLIPQLKLQSNLIWHHVENLVLSGLLVVAKSP
ncbi:type III pantothenate kinase [Undibacterium danionis]|uniref:Type III pantothenate kinase n=1 Tax=Undibacterium danionis TaxID=1812100 RepID=A0ABV6IDT9_9BURK